MSFTFGLIKKFTDRGFGSVETEHGDIFLHIKTVKNSTLYPKLNSVNGSYINIKVWIEYEATAKGKNTNKVSENVLDYPSEKVEEYLRSHLAANLNSLFFLSLGEIFRNYTAFSKTKEINDLISDILKMDDIKNHPYRVSKILPAILKNKFLQNYNLESLWFNEDIPYWVEEFTEDMLGTEKLNEFKERYVLFEKELEEKKEKERLLELNRHVEKYKNIPIGIRNEFSLRNICINCGSDKVVGSSEWGYNKVCSQCKSRWYANHCWNCGLPVDSRDTENPKCNTCGWLKCTCGACNYGGCSTNPYNKDNKLKDVKKNIAKIEDFDDSLIDDQSGLESCDWCNSPRVTYRDEAHTLCESCSDQLFGD